MDSKMGDDASWTGSAHRIFAYEPVLKAVTGSQLVLPLESLSIIYEMNRRLSTGDDASI